MRSDSVSLAGACDLDSGRSSSRAGGVREAHPVVDASSSGRASGDTPAASKTSGATTPASDRRSILRRCPKAVRTSANSASRSTAGGSRRSIRTSADSTLGRGTNTVAGTCPTMRAVAQYATFTLTAPYACCRAGGEALADLALHHHEHRSIGGTSSSRSHTSGVATLYGRLATSTQRSPPASSACQSSAHRVGLDHGHVGTVGDDLAQHRHDAGVDLDRGDRRRRSRRAPASASRGRRRSRRPGRRARRRRGERSGARCSDRRRSSDRGRAAAPGRMVEQLVDATRATVSIAVPGDLDRHRRVGEVGDLREGAVASTIVVSGGAPPIDETHCTLRLLSRLVTVIVALNGTVRRWRDTAESSRSRC